MSNNKYSDNYSKIFGEVKENNTGTYKIDKRTGKCIKISNKIPSIKNFWFAKHKIDGNKDLKDCYSEFERRGELNKVDDREVWQEFADR